MLIRGTSDLELALGGLDQVLAVVDFAALEGGEAEDEPDPRVVGGRGEGPFGLLEVVDELRVWNEFVISGV